ncbi:patatin-like protein [Amycolatopsis rubida]|uniref:Patatin-like protein n=1 Tax=Amycolatopsis rubida TaxID=112413 RepID=A0ABX0C4B4_9PSEU|nr:MULTISPECIES: patatin-like protein [Amycolatopsis]MYW97625.1 patatin-like protein [Amycolatopsis rubida]NEC62610.1 patatin-like protein [Amycolatopsis rubida]OAP27372.1 Patatin-like phospholipase [Amycolatopsis sp. M39]
MGETAVPWPQEIRIAMAMVGGSSLAVWMGGVATETSALLHASRTPDASNGYRKLLDLLHASVRLDVLTGTSAGGINAACLGLAEAYRSTPAILRDTWFSAGSLENLIRDPGETQPRSVLNGDKVLLGGLVQAMHDITGSGVVPTEPPDVTVLLTGTMLDGETTQYDDALGNRVRDTEHRMLFRFDGPLWNNQVHGPLALAARSSASFPGAFELSRMPIGPEAADRMHPDMTDYTELVRSHWLADGGVLVNKPLRPALREIFERSSSTDVRRLLLYVVPTVDGEAKPMTCDPADPPMLGTALAKVASTIMSQTISVELEELSRHNSAVTRTRDTRVALASLGLRGGQLVDDRVHRAYLDRRVALDAAELVRAVTRRYELSDEDGGWAAGNSALLQDIAADGLRRGIPDTLPGESVTVGEMVRYRTSTLEDAVATGIQLINAGFRMGPGLDQATQLNEVRAKMHAARRSAARDVRLSAWVARHEPPRPGTSMPDWIGQLAAEWADLGASDAVREAWPELTGALRSAAPVLQSLSGKENQWSADAADTVTTLLDWFGLDNADVADGFVMARFLLLHMATRGLLAEAPAVDQRVDLVQMSADSRTLLDLARPRGRDKLTGTQASNFGGFYKASWRANDWMWGRIDGAGWLTQCLLDPKRLRVLRDIVGPGEFREQVRTTFREIGWEPPSPADNGMPADLSGLLAQLGDELAFLGLDANLSPVDFGKEIPTSLPVTSMVLAKSRQLAIAREELPVLASQAEADAKEGNGKASESFRKLMVSRPLEQKVEKTAVQPENGGQPDAAQRAFQACQVSAERFEGELGSTLLTKTIVKAGAAGLNAASTAARVPKTLQPLAKFTQFSSRSAWWVTQGATRLGRPWNLLAAAITAIAGFVLSGEGGSVLQWLGLPVAGGALVFLVVSLLTLRRTWRMVLTVLGVLVIAALLFAAFLPPIAQPLFGWLGTVVDGWRRGQAPLWWLAVVALLLLPAIWTPLSGLGRRKRRRSGPDRPR